jgi:hypothetical protein
LTPDESEIDPVGQEDIVVGVSVVVEAMHGSPLTSHDEVILLVQQFQAPPGLKWQPSPPHCPQNEGQQKV